MKQISRLIPSCLWLIFLTGQAGAAVVVLDDFEVNEGRFALAPTFSGSTTSLLTTSTADRVTTEFNTGAASQALVLNDNTATESSAGVAWFLRHLSGSGAPANNTSITNSATTYVGYYLKTTDSNLEASLMIDDGTGLEMAVYQPIIADGLWHLYQFQLSDAGMWDAFAGVGANGAIDAATVTIDSIHLRATTGVPSTATVFIDTVAYDTAGPIPEPGSFALLGVGLLVGLRRWR